MGSLNLDALGTDGAARETAEALLGRTEVGGRDLTDVVPAMEVGLSVGRPIFLSEERMQVAFQPRSVVLAEGRPSWLRLEVKVLKNGRRRPLHLLLAGYPWSGRYAEVLPFRSPTKRPKGALDDAVACDPAMAADHQKLIEHVEGLSYELFETDSRFLTAGLSMPGPQEANHTLREKRLKGRHVFGFTEEDPRTLVEVLLGSEPAQALLRVTEKGAINVVPGVALKNGAEPMRLAEEVRDRRDEFLLLAVRQALAGPPDTEGLPSADWAGRPVMDLVSLIYRDHLYNAQRRVLRREKQTTHAEAWDHDRDCDEERSW